MKRKRLGEILQEAGLVSEEQIQKALKIKSRTGKRIGKIFIEMEWVSELDICQTLSRQLGIPLISLKNRKSIRRYWVSFLQSFASKGDWFP